MALEHIERRAARIRQRRKALSLTQEAVAERMQDIHQERHPDDKPDQTRGQMVSDWERAVNEPSPPKLELLAAALEWSVGELNRDAGGETAPAPDVMAALNDNGLSELRAIRERLDRIEEMVETNQNSLRNLLDRRAEEAAAAELPADAPERQQAEQPPAEATPKPTQR